jgi:shikimate dehydrogenase
VARALGAAGAADVAVLNRSSDRGARAATLAGPAGRVGSAADVAGADLVVNATSLGMGLAGPGPDPLPLDPAALHPGQVVVDIVYHPAVTPLMREATARGATAVGGLGMLVHQAAHAYRRWTAGDPPIEAMTTAARHALARRPATA